LIPKALAFERFPPSIPASFQEPPLKFLFLLAQTCVEELFSVSVKAWRHGDLKFIVSLKQDGYENERKEEHV